MTGWIYAALGLCGVCVLIAMIRSGRFVSALLLTIVQGAAAFFAANFVGEFFGVSLPLNLPSLAVAALGGTPGVILLLLVQTICRLP